MTDTMTLAEYHAQRNTHRARNKYRNKRVRHDGYTFDSMAERDRYIELKLLQDRGYISELQVHPRYVIVDKFTDGMGNKHQARCYVADFEYQEDGRIVVEDVKGYQTAVFKLKKVLFLRRYPEYVFRMVNA
jgi:Fe2+ transport system protein B